MSLQVQSDAQYKYLYEAVAAYAKRVRNGEKPSDDLVKPYDPYDLGDD